MKTIMTCCVLALFTLTSTPQSLAAANDAATATAVSSTSPAAAAPDTSSAHAPAIYRGGTLASDQLNQFIGVAVSGTSLSVYSACKDKGTLNNGDGTLQAANKCTSDSFKSDSNWADPYTVPTSSIKTITWEQYKHHRILTGAIVSIFFWPAGIPIMFTTLEKDNISITWDNHGATGMLTFQADKKQYHSVLDALSKASGVSVASVQQ